ncbi:MAG: ribosome assembly factor SBDS [Candidatus Thermoplasmatota archaeon]|jgi:ribosome maturation protein SDO1|nr:ribosome assembly factor SBDS [Candidatus Thermoplasmatota archaeon]
MVSLDKAVIAQLEKMGETFEIFVDPDLAQKYREGEKGIELGNILAVEMVFKDAHKGERMPSETLHKVLGTIDELEAARIVLEKGDIQLTTEQRKRIQEEKRKQVIALIVRNCINPVTKTPHPPVRIEMAMEEARVNIDPFKSAESQVQDVIKELRPLIPIRMEMTQIAIKVNGSHYGKLIGECRSYGKVLRDEWTKGGEWVCLVEIPAGLQIEFYDMLNKRTHGEVETKILNH